MISILRFAAITIVLLTLFNTISSNNTSRIEIPLRFKRSPRHIYPSVPITPLKQSKHPFAYQGKFNEEILRKYYLDIHNQLRSKHNTPPLQYSIKLQQTAKKFCDELAYENVGLYHDEKNYYEGENLFSIIQRTIPDEWELAKLTMNTFYDELKFYSYDRYNPRGLINYGHASQLLWYNSKYVGIGFSVVKGRGTFKVYICMRYDPPGNVMNAWQFRRNVLPRNY
uniref:SCP domain-containing protein n=1 Tax=Parastrongyloides trichosuri TaxID=131310 RepID=A0A0N4ZF98_PARTI